MEFDEQPAIFIQKKLKRELAEVQGSRFQVELHNRIADVLLPERVQGVMTLLKLTNKMQTGAFKTEIVGSLLVFIYIEGSGAVCVRLLFFGKIVRLLLRRSFRAIKFSKKSMASRCQRKIFSKKFSRNFPLTKLFSKKFSKKSQKKNSKKSKFPKNVEGIASKITFKQKLWEPYGRGIQNSTSSKNIFKSERSERNSPQNSTRS